MGLLKTVLFSPLVSTQFLWVLHFNAWTMCVRFLPLSVHDLNLRQQQLMWRYISSHHAKKEQRSPPSAVTDFAIFLIKRHRESLVRSFSTCFRAHIAIFCWTGDHLLTKSARSTLQFSSLFRNSVPSTPQRAMLPLQKGRRVFMLSNLKFVSTPPAKECF